LAKCKAFITLNESQNKYHDEVPDLAIPREAAIEARAAKA